MRIASVEGLGQLTIGRLATEVGVSKSGLYAHFGSKQQLQLETIDAAREVFAREVVEPGLAAPEGIDQLVALTDAFLDYVRRRVFPGGCFFASMLGEFDAQPGTLREQVARDHQGWIQLLGASAAEAQRLGQLDPAVDVDQLVFEVHAALELGNYYDVLFRGSEHLERARQAIHAALERAAAGSAA